MRNGKPLISFNDKEYKLAQIDENEFIILGFEDSFGAGNRRIIFNTKGFEEKIYFSGQLLNKFWENYKIKRTHNSAQAQPEKGMRLCAAR